MKNLKCVFVCYVGLSVYAVDGQYFFYLKIELSKSTYKMLYLVHLKGMFLRIKYSKTVNFSLVKLSYVNLIIQFSQSVLSDSLRPHELAACQASLSITSSQSPPKPMSI